MLAAIGGFFRGASSSEEQVPALIVELEETKQEWLYMQSVYHTVSEPDMVDYISYLVKAHEMKYTYLLKKAKEQGLIFFPRELALAARSEPAARDLLGVTVCHLCEFLSRAFTALENCLNRWGRILSVKWRKNTRKFFR